MSAILSSHTQPINIRFSCMMLLKNLMDLNNLIFIQHVQEALLLDLTKVAALDPKNLEDPKNQEETLLELARECLFVWGKIYGADFLDVYEFLLSEEVKFPKQLKYFKEESFEKGLGIKINKTDILNSSTKEDVTLFGLENKLKLLQGLIEDNSGGGNENQEMDSIKDLIFFIIQNFCRH